MSSLTRLEVIKLEKLFEMSGGYVLDFSNRTFGDFVFEVLSIDIYDAKYTVNGSSKAKVLRSFWTTEPDAIVGRLLSELIEYWKTKRLNNFRKETDEEKVLLVECEKIAVRLSEGGETFIVETLKPRSDDKNFSLLSRSIRDSLESGQPEAALDHLHTYLVRYIRSLGESRNINFDKEKPLHSTFGELVKVLRANGEIESEMADRILRSSISVMESFNDVRNNRSLAHDNAVLNYEESILIFANVSSAIRFLEAVEKKKSTVAPRAPADEYPF
jgi:hypothetical protein